MKCTDRENPQRLSALCARLREDIVGARTNIDGPFGARMITYADYTASGRSLAILEDYLRHTAVVEYANTHTEDSATGRRTSQRSAEAEALVKKSVGADENDAAIFVGTGSTGAIKRFQEILGLVIPPGCEAAECRKNQEQPAVVIGPYEHHSNEVTWRETIAEVIECPLDPGGLIDLAALNRILEDLATGNRRLIGSFSAASNVTGVKSDVHAIARILHRHGAIACFDYAALAPYVPINIHPAGDPDAALDAIFLSLHKMLGGPDTPGVLIFRRDLYERVGTSNGLPMIVEKPHRQQPRHDPFRSVNSWGRHSGARGRRFKSFHPDHLSISYVAGPEAEADDWNKTGTAIRQRWPTPPSKPPCARA